MRLNFSVSGLPPPFEDSRHEPRSDHHTAGPEAVRLLDESSTDSLGALAVSTRRQYSKYQTFFDSFMKHFFCLSWHQASAIHVRTFVTFLFKHNKLSLTYIKSHLSGISYLFKSHCIDDPTKKHPVMQIIKAYDKLSSANSTRKPITHDILANLLFYVEHCYSNAYYRHSLFSLYTLMYRLALRISEICDYSEHFSHALQYKACTVHTSTNTIEITLYSYKHSTSKSTFLVKCSNTFLHHFLSYLSLRGPHSGPLFCHKNGAPFTRNFVLKHLRSALRSAGLNDTYYNTHSFRSGLATDLATQGCSESKLAIIGRWKSRAYQSYIRPQTIAV